MVQDGLTCPPCRGRSVLQCWHSCEKCPQARARGLGTWNQRLLVYQSGIEHESSSHQPKIRRDTSVLSVYTLVFNDDANGVVSVLKNEKLSI